MTFLSNSPQQGLCFIVSAPAGTGKTTLVQMLVDEFPSVIANISYTTRQPRVGEINGKDYHFIAQATFQEKIAAGEFLEYVKLYDDYYGCSKKWIVEQQSQGKHVILVIDTQGALQLKEQIPAIFIFISPPSMEELRRRLAARKTESPEIIEKRIAWASHEMESASHYDYLIVNDHLLSAYQVLRSIIIAETHRIDRKI